MKFFHIYSFFLKNEQITFARDLFRSSTCLTRADKSRILAYIAGVRGNVKYFK